MKNAIFMPNTDRFTVDNLTIDISPIHSSHQIDAPVTRVELRFAGPGSWGTVSGVPLSSLWALSDWLYRKAEENPPPKPSPAPELPPHVDEAQENRLVTLRAAITHQHMKDLQLKWEVQESPTGRTFATLQHPEVFAHATDFGLASSYSVLDKAKNETYQGVAANFDMAFLECAEKVVDLLETRLQKVAEELKS